MLRFTYAFEATVFQLELCRSAHSFPVGHTLAAVKLAKRLERKNKLAQIQTEPQVVESS